MPLNKARRKCIEYHNHKVSDFLLILHLVQIFGISDYLPKQIQILDALVQPFLDREDLRLVNISFLLYHLNKSILMNHFCN